MFENKLHQLLIQISDKTIADIAHHLDSPSIKNREISLLFSILKDNLAVAKTGLTKVKVFKKIYPDLKYDDQKWRLLNSQLLKKVENHLVSKVSGIENTRYHLDLLGYYKEQNLKSHYEAQLKRTIKYFAKSKIQDSDFNDQLVYLEDEKSNFLLGQKRNQRLNIQETLDQTDVAFLIKKLKFACSALAHKSIYTIEYDMGLLKEVESRIPDFNLDKYPALDMYYICYQMLREPDNLVKFENYRTKIISLQERFETSEIRNIYLLGINMCIRRLNKGEKQFGKIGMQMYEEALKAKHLLINGKLSRYTYRNIAMMAIRADDFKWADYFTEIYKVHLKKSELKSSYHLNKALIHYYQKELELARDNILEADFKDHLISLAAKNLQAKIYYELKEHMLLESHLDSMEMYIIRKKVIGYHKQNYKNFISHLRKLIRHKTYDTNATEKLKNKILNTEVLTEKSWFSSQLADLKSP